MIRLEFATDAKRTCKTCAKFDRDGMYCTVQRSETGLNTHPALRNPEAWTCLQHSNGPEVQR